MHRIKELRQAQNLTQKELAEKITSTSKSIWAYENQIATPPLDVLNKLADFFECSIDYLTGRSDDFGVISIKNPSNFNFSPKTKEMLSIFEYLPKEYQAQVLEYARYIAERLSKSNTRQR